MVRSLLPQGRRLLRLPCGVIDCHSLRGGPGGRGLGTYRATVVGAAGAHELSEELLCTLISDKAPAPQLPAPAPPPDPTMPPFSGPPTPFLSHVFSLQMKLVTLLDLPVSNQ